MSRKRRAKVSRSSGYLIFATREEEPVGELTQKEMRETNTTTESLDRRSNLQAPNG